MTDSLISAPGGFVPAAAVAFGASGGAATAVDASHPLPTAATMAAASSTPLAGTTAAATTAGPFAPQLDRPIFVTLSGSWSGTAQLLRSTDGGATKLPLTLGGSVWASFSGNCNEPVWTETDAAAAIYLMLSPVSGTIGYRVAQ